MNYNEALDYILSIPKFGVKSGLDNITTLLNLLGNPQDDLKIVHVAGTNGKGSVCTMLSYILCENGYKTGLFTSPHLIKLNERIKINNHDIDDEELASIFTIIKEKIDDMVANGHNHPTFFEVVVAIAFYYYKKEKVDYVVLETGLGGRLDPTNVIKNPVVSVITPIGYDHTAILGDTIEEIAREKAGIIKKGRPTVLYYDQSEVYDVFEVECSKKTSKLYSYENFEFNILKRSKKNIDFSINNKYYKYGEVYLNVVASYQIINASIALTVVEVLKYEGVNLSEKAVLDGLKQFRWSGRMEYLTDNIMIDGAHNTLGIQMFVKEIQTTFKDREITILFASMQDKPYADMIKELKKCNNINRVILTQINSDRAAKVNQLEQAFNQVGFSNIQKLEDIDEAVSYAIDLSVQGEMVCCIGSLYLVGYIKSKIEEEEEDACD